MNVISPVTGSSAARRNWRLRIVRGGVGTLLAGVLGLSGTLVTAGVAGAVINSSTAGTTYYVDVNGSDAGNCSQFSPCATLGQALFTAYDTDALLYGTVTIQFGPGTFYENNNFVDSINGLHPDVVIAGLAGQTYFQSDGNSPAVTSDCANVTIEGIQFSGYNQAVSNICGHLVVENSVFEDNGTGVYSSPEDGWVTTIVNNSSFFYNEAGIYAADLKLVVDGSTFAQNLAGVDIGAAYATINNSTFTMNEDGIYVDAGTAQITSSTIDRNSTGIYNNTQDSTAVTSFATIVVNNSSSNCGGTSITDNGYNLDNDGSCGFSSNNGSDFHDPKLGSLQDNGGYTWTQAILPGSYAYEKVPAANCPSVDQRGETRPDTSTSSFCDIGAYEYNAPVAIQFVSDPLNGITSFNANLGSATVQAIDNAGLPAVSTHAMTLTLSSTNADANFALSNLGASTTHVIIPTGSTTGSFYTGSVTPGLLPITVTAMNAITSLGSASQTETVVTGPAFYLDKTGGDAQTTTVGTPFTLGLSVNTTDFEDNPVLNETITYAVTSGGATFSGSSTATAQTDALGNASSPTLTAGTVPGPVTVTATTSTNVVVTFNLTQVVGPPATITIDSGNNQTVVSDQAFTTPLQVTVADSFGNVISGAQVDFEVTSGSSSFAGSAITSSNTDGSGNTSVSSLTAGDLGGTQSITATVDGTTVQAAFSGIVITPKATTATVSSFTLGSSVLTVSMKKQLDTLAATIKKYGNTSASITGYASNEGSTKLNISLSLARAAAAKTYLAADLKALKVSGVSISAIGKGATNFVSSNHSAAVNRRVIVAIH
jgi:outer membrane protein OmpA-like peptidoglycan-associated protein